VSLRDAPRLRVPSIHMRNRLIRVATALLTLLPLAPAFAISEFALRFGDIEGEGFAAHGLQLTIGLGDLTTGRLAIDRLQLGTQTFEGVEVNCGSMSLSRVSFRCDDGEFRVPEPGLDDAQFRGSLRIRLDGSEYAVHLRDVAVAGGRMDLDFDYADQHQSAVLTTRDVAIARIAEFVAETAPDLTLPEGAVATGRVSGTVHMVNGPGGIEQLSLELAIAQLSGGDAAGLNAADALDAHIDFSGADFSDGISGPFELSLSAGALYVQPSFLTQGVYLDATAHQLVVSGVMASGADGSLRIADLALDHAGVMRTEGGSFESSADSTTLTLTQLDGQLPALYKIWVEPFAYGGELAGLTTAGQVAGTVAIADAALARLDLTLTQVSASSATAGYAVAGLDGQLRWSATSTAELRSDLRWQSGALFGLPLGAARVTTAQIGDDLRLLEAVRIPLLDGAIVLQRLELRDMNDEVARAFRMDAIIEPLDLLALTRALGWPEMGGTIAGRIPEIAFADGQLTFGGALEAAVFDGQVQVNNLRMIDPFSVLPRVRGDIVARGLDLALVTRTFTLGSIEGRLDADVLGFRFAGGAATAFDASLRTPPGDRSRHRISQRAVENISSLGGGGSAALSRGFLRMFQSFRYDRLGISCRLVEQVCNMSGVIPHPDGGYYMIKGSGLPRIDVIGDRAEVDWPTLVQQLQRVMAGEGPTIGD